MNTKTSSEKRIIWEQDPHRDNDVFAKNKKGEPLGCLSYENLGRHMHWCWYQFTDIRMSPGCLQEVRDKQKELFKEVRNSQKD